MKEAETRKPKGYPRIKASHGRLQLTWKYQGESQYLSLGLDDTLKGRTTADNIALAIWNDLSLDRYSPGNNQQYLPRYLQKGESSKEHSVIQTYYDLWVKYLEAEGANLGLSTRTVKNPPITKLLSRHPKLKIREVEKLVAILSVGVSDSSLRTKYGQIRAACTWAVREKLLPTNPLKDYVLPKCKHEEERGGDPFEVWELEAILSAFDTAKHSEWHSVIRFLLLTGCRPSEAFALRDYDVDFRSGKIVFNKRRLAAGGAPTEQDGLKTQKQRVFPMGDELRDLCLELVEKQQARGVSHLLTVSGQPLDTNKLSRVWRGNKRRNRWEAKGVVAALAEAGKIKHYRSAYSLRDSFITHSLKQGVPAHTVAKWVGNSPATIDKFYAGALDEFTPRSPLSPV